MKKDLFGIMPESPRMLCCLFMAGCAIMLTPSGALKFLNTSVPVISKEEARNQPVHIGESVNSSRTKREMAMCPEGKVIPEGILNDVQIDDLLLYTSMDLKLCLTKENLVNNISVFSDYPFTDEQLQAVKDKLDEVFPEGYPLKVIHNLGLIEKLIDDKNIKQWTINSSSTVHALLDSLSSDKQKIAVIQRYIELRKEIDSDFLDVLVPYVCFLEDHQLSVIIERSTEMDTLLDPSNCSSAIKDYLYPKAKRAFSDRHYKYNEYYKRIRPFLGGAPGEDLKALSKNDVNMDIQTFLGLKGSSLEKLTPEDVKGLLGRNLNNLRDHQNTPLIREWIQKQKQSDLNSLDLGLYGGLPEGFIILKRRKQQD